MAKSEPKLDAETTTRRERKPRPRSKPPADAIHDGLTITLLRHGKSDWADDELADFERPLARRGEKAVPRIASAMAALGIAPDIVLCSSANRTAQTLDLVRPHLGGSTGIELDRSLYLASPSHMLARIQGLAPGFRHIMVIGHNPGLHALALDLIRDGDREMISALARKLPTAGLVVMHFPMANWTGIQTATGTLQHFLTPARLE
jgi:phosphohistidine phosphatase